MTLVGKGEGVTVVLLLLGRQCREAEGQLRRSDDGGVLLRYVYE